MFTALGCKKALMEPLNANTSDSTNTIAYAKGFQISPKDGYTLLTVTPPDIQATKKYRYALLKKGGSVPKNKTFDAVITVPISKLVVTSTTHIPSLEALGEIDKLIGFPHLDYISSPQARSRIDDGLITELGQNESINTEVTLELKPDLIVGFAIHGENRALNFLNNSGIPVLYNGDWLEKHPLGKAEWVKFFGVLLDQSTKADSIFNSIKTSYQEIKKIASKQPNKPTVLSGAMYKDTWYLPHGNSWAGTLIEHAGGDYLWKNAKGQASLALNLETVLEKGQNADFWFSPSEFTSYSQLKDANQVYSKFKAFKTKNVYTYAAKKGPTGGLLFYELAPNRPDLALKDLVHFLHPKVYPEYSPTFYSPLVP